MYDKNKYLSIRKENSSEILIIHLSNFQIYKTIKNELI